MRGVVGIRLDQRLVNLPSSDKSSSSLCTESHGLAGPSGIDPGCINKSCSEGGGGNPPPCAHDPLELELLLLLTLAVATLGSPTELRWCVFPIPLDDTVLFKSLEIYVENVGTPWLDLDLMPFLKSRFSDRLACIV